MLINCLFAFVVPNLTYFQFSLFFFSEALQAFETKGRKPFSVFTLLYLVWFKVLLWMCARLRYDRKRTSQPQQGDQIW